MGHMSGKHGDRYFFLLLKPLEFMRRSKTGAALQVYKSQGHHNYRIMSLQRSIHAGCHLLAVSRLRADHNASKVNLYTCEIDKRPC
jgi:hypothetical protein